MIILALIGLCCLVVVFVMSCFNTVADPNQTFQVKIVEYVKTRINRAGVVHTQTGVRKQKDGTRALTDTEKRRRFMWYAVLCMPPIVFILVYLIEAA